MRHETEKDISDWIGRIEGDRQREREREWKNHRVKQDNMKEKQERTKARKQNQSKQNQKKHKKDRMHKSRSCIFHTKRENSCPPIS